MAELEKQLRKDLQWYFYDWHWRGVQDELNRRLAGMSRDTEEEAKASWKLQEQLADECEAYTEQYKDRLSEMHWNLCRWMESHVPGTTDWKIPDVIPLGKYIRVSGKLDTGLTKHFISIRGRLCGHIPRDYNWTELNASAPEIFEDGTPSDDEVIWDMRVSAGGRDHIFGGATGLEAYEDATEMAVAKTLDFLDKQLSRMSALHNLLSRM